MSALDSSAPRMELGEFSSYLPFRGVQMRMLVSALDSSAPRMELGVIRLLPAIQGGPYKYLGVRF